MKISSIETLKNEAKSLLKSIPFPGRNDDNHRFSPFLGYTYPDEVPSIKVSVDCNSLSNKVIFGEFEEVISQVLDYGVDFNGIPEKLRADYFSLKNFEKRASTWLLYIPDNTTVSETVTLNLKFGRGVGDCNIALVMVFGKNSEAAVIQKFASENASSDGALLNCMTSLYLMDGARVKFHGFQNISSSVDMIQREFCHLERDSFLDMSALSLGSRRSQTRTEVDLNGPGASAELICGNRSDSDQYHDFWTSLNHEQENTSAHSKYFMVLDGSSKAVFNGNQVVRRHALNTDSSQVNKNLLISDKANVFTLPKLEIDNDEVQCSHGASVVKVDEDQLFYLTSRGIPSRIAEKMIIDGFLEAVFEKIPGDDQRESLRAEFTERFSV